MRPPDHVVDEAVRGVLDGTPVNWTGLESSADADTLALSEQLKVLSSIGAVHRAEPLDSGRRERWGHLRLLERVGAGAFGEVYRAWDSRLDREVALKLLPASVRPGEGASPVIEEGRLLARVRHPNVATIFGAELIDDRIGLWMEFVRGRTLEELLRSGHQFSLYDVIDVGVQLCHAVSAVHGAGLLHRDIKAQNVMRADDGRVVLMDFGAGRERADIGMHPAGTPLYLAPEVLSGGPSTVQSDVYGIGVLLYHLLTGNYPVQARSMDELAHAHASNVRTDLQDVRPDLPPALITLIRRATAANASQRYASPDAVAADLLPLKNPAKRRWAAVALVAAATALLAWGAWEVRRITGSSNTTTNTGVAAAAYRPGDRPVIVVLPFRNLRADAGSDVLADGLTYELIRSLAVINGLDVRSATSSFALKGQTINLASIGQQLGVNLVLEGSVSGSGDQLRVQAHLANVAGDTPLWTNKFDRQVTDVLAIQDEIARSVVNQLRLALGTGQRQYALDAESATLYLKARTLVERRRTEDAEAAVPLFQQIIARDPTFAPAYAGLADAYAFMSQSLPDVLGMHHVQALGLMRSAAEKSIELDPLLAEAHAAMGFLHSRDLAWDDAARSFERAIELNPSLTHVYTSYSLSTLLPLGRFDQAEALLDEARRRDPLSLHVQRELALLFLTSGRYDEALRLLDAMRAVDPQFPALPLLRARAQSLAGRYEEAMPYWDSVRTIVGSQHWMAYAFVRAGRRAEIEQLAASPQVAYRQVLFFAALGDNDRALAALEIAAKEAPHRVVRLLQYPELAGLRGDPRFEAVRETFRLP